MDFIGWLASVLGISRVFAGLIVQFILVLLGYIIPGFLMLRHERSKRGKVDPHPLPEGISPTAIATKKLIYAHPDVDFLKKPLHKQLQELHAMQKTTFPRQITIPVTAINSTNIPFWLDLHGLNYCDVCKRQITDGEPHGYYTCCYKVSHTNHIFAWHVRSKHCPFCREVTNFTMIIS